MSIVKDIIERRWTDEFQPLVSFLLYKKDARATVYNTYTKDGVRRIAIQLAWKFNKVYTLTVISNKDGCTIATDVDDYQELKQELLKDRKLLKTIIGSILEAANYLVETYGE